MNRRNFLKRCGIVVGSIGLSPTAVRAGLKIKNKTMEYQIGRRRPNVIYILADDLGYGDPGCFGQQQVKTPNIDKLAAEGMKFTQHYAGSAVCGPSRCSLMTGLHTGHCYIRGNAVYSLRPEDWTLAEVFKKTGYSTACIGKWGLGGIGETGHPNNQGFDYFYGYLGHGHAHHYYTTYLFRNSEQITLDGQTYTHDLLTEEALDFIERSKNRPFFLYLPYTIPHREVVCPTKDPYTSESWPEIEKTFAAMVTRMDRDIGRIMDLIKQLGFDDDTMVIFTSDNGPHSKDGHSSTYFTSSGSYGGENLRGEKRDLYEGGVRAPMVARWPGKIPASTQTEHICAFWDVLPTFADLVGMEIGNIKWGDISETVTNMDGISFLPTLLGKAALQKQHEHLYWEFYEENYKQAVRKGKWKMVRLNVKSYSTESAYLNDTNTSNIKLFDLDIDPGEDTNLASTYPTIRDELKTLIAQEHTKAYLSNFRFTWE